MMLLRMKELPPGVHLTILHVENNLVFSKNLSVLIDVRHH